MKIKQVLAFAMFLLLAMSSIMAQDNHRFTLGIDFGGNSSQEGDFFPGDPGWKSGYVGGVTAEYSLPKCFSIKTGVYYEQKGYSVSGQAPDTSNHTTFVSPVYYNKELDYYVVPVLAKFTFGNKWNFFAEGGLYAGLITKAVFNETLSANSGVQFQSNNIIKEYNPIDLGAILGGGVCYSFHRFSIDIEAKFCRSIPTTFAPWTRSRFGYAANQSYTLLLGIGYKI